DLGTRRGLRQVHRQFNDIHARLHQAYMSAKDQRFPQLMAGVVGLMVKMNVDVILRQKLFERGILQKVVWLLEYEETRPVALQTLLGFTYYTGRFCKTIHKDVARLNEALSRLVAVHSTDPLIVEIILAIMAHATKCVLDDSSQHAALASDAIFLIPSQLSVVSAISNPANHSLSTLTHALQLLAFPTERFPEECSKVPALQSLLVAFLRSNDIGTRALAMTGLLNVSRHSVSTQVDSLDVRLQQLGDALQGLIPHPSAFADIPPEEFKRWLPHSHSMLLYRSSIEYLTSMAQAAQDHNFQALGHKLADLFQRSPLVIEADWKAFQQVTSAPEPRSASIPSQFESCLDTLPECIRVLREKGGASDVTAADIIEMKCLLMDGCLSEAIAFATGVLEREPRLAFAHYVLSMDCEPENSLHMAKAGLQCPGVTQFLREHMLWRAVDMGCRKALTAMLRAVSGGDEAEGRRAQEESRVLLISALNDAETLIAEMAPDTPLLLALYGWTILITLVLRGNKVTSALDELEPVFRSIDTTKELMRYFGYPVNKTDLYLAWNLIVETYWASGEEWRPVIEAYDGLGGRIGHFEPHMSVGLSTWFTADNCDPTVDDRATLARCSSCKSPSAALKRCKGCRIAWYCDRACQRSDWSMHRDTCKGRRQR
ncbi:hypothetical protein LXA43DRAFT_904680, partial [Ganoderma leucocontextum]